MDGFLISIYIALTIIALIIAAVAPGSIPKKAMDTADIFKGLNCAHRGLHSAELNIPENSKSAFLAARERGYGVELDVHLTADDQVVVFHDYDLSRVCKADVKIGALTFDELQNYRLFDTDERIPLFSDVLEALGDTPVVVEIKSAGNRNRQLCGKTYDVLRRHGKIWCVQSFDPRICGWFKQNAPEVFRGMLVCRPGEYVGISAFSSIILGNLLFNFIARPHYIAHKNSRPTLPAGICMLMKPLKATWTITNDDDIQKAESENDFVIFEHYEPAARFR